MHKRKAQKLLKEQDLLKMTMMTMTMKTVTIGRRNRAIPTMKMPVMPMRSRARRRTQLC